MHARSICIANEPLHMYGSVSSIVAISSIDLANVVVCSSCSKCRDECPFLRVRLYDSNTSLAGLEQIDCLCRHLVSSQLPVGSRAMERFAGLPPDAPQPAPGAMFYMDCVGPMVARTPACHIASSCTAALWMLAVHNYGRLWPAHHMTSACCCCSEPFVQRLLSAKGK